MARPTPTPSFGSAFNADKFRDAIRNTMVMGLPNASLDKPTFKWTAGATYTHEDPSRNPYSWDETPVSEDDTPADVQVPCAVEFISRSAMTIDNAMGQFDTPRVIITLLDVDYEDVEGATVVEIGQTDYVIDFWAPPVALFDVDVYTAYCTAVDEA